MSVKWCKIGGCDCFYLDDFIGYEPTLKFLNLTLLTPKNHELISPNFPLRINNTARWQLQLLHRNNSRHAVYGLFRL